MLTFHPSYRSQAFRIIQIFIATGLLLVWGYIYFQDPLSFGGLFVCGFWLVFWGGSVVLSLRRLRKIRILMDDQSLQVNSGNEFVQIDWKDILFIRRVGDYL